jgi:ketosteroid isomerase-like protein
MGVDQYTSQHVFEPLPDGGRIVLQRKESDSVGEAAIRAHMRQISRAFATGDFEVPGFVHASTDVPGTAAMRRLKAEINYTPRDLPRGAEVVISTRNPEAVAAIHEFLAFQRMDHRAGMH